MQKWTRPPNLTGGYCDSTRGISRRLVGDGSRDDLQGWRSTICTLLLCICLFSSFLLLILLGFGRGRLGFSVFFPPTCSEFLLPRQGRASWRLRVSAQALLVSLAPMLPPLHGLLGMLVLSSAAWSHCGAKIPSTTIVLSRLVRYKETNGDGRLYTSKGFEPFVTMLPHLLCNIGENYPLRSDSGS